MSTPLNNPSQNQKPPQRRSRLPKRVAIGLLLLGGFYVSSRPYMESRALTRENNAIEQESKRLNEEAEQYRRENNALTTPQGRELIGRRAGLVGIGENHLVIP